LVEESKKNTKKSWIGPVVGLVFVGLIISLAVILNLFPEEYPKGFVEDWIADLQDLKTYDVCVNWVGTEKGGECFSWKSDQRLENCPKIVIDKLGKEFCILE